MTSLEANLNAILNEKESKILPENIKSGVTIFGIEGNLKTSSGVKLFETVEDMNSDTTSNIDDMALIYRNTLGALEVGKTYTSLYLPKTITLDSAITSTTNIFFSTGTILNATHFVRLTSSAIQFYRQSGFSGAALNTVKYSSTDGITYTRTDSLAEVLTVAEIYTSSGTTYQTSITIQETNANILRQMFSAPNSYFGGIYKYLDVMDTDILKAGYLASDYVADKTAELTTEKWIYTKGMTHTNMSNGCCIGIISEAINYNNKTVYKLSNYYGYGTSLIYDVPNNKYYVGRTYTSDTEISTYNMTYRIYENDKFVERTITGNISDLPFKAYGSTESTSSTFYYSYILEEVDIDNVLFIIVGSGSGTTGSSLKIYNYDTTVSYVEKFMTTSYNEQTTNTTKYVDVPTQLNATANDVFEKEFFGANGIETGTIQNNTNLNKEEIQSKSLLWDKLSTLTVDTSTTSFSALFNGYKGESIPMIDTSSTKNVTQMFYGCTNLRTIPLLNTENVTDMSSMFYGCSSLEEIPLLNTSNVTATQYMFRYCTNLKAVPSLDTSEVVYFTSMFEGCSSLKDAPVFDASKAGNMTQMFKDCTSLSDESLNNILLTCVSSPISGTYAKLSQIGLTQAQATKCTTLSNYEAFTAAGWTTGY